MPIYRVTEETFQPLNKTSFEAEKLLEREDIQRRLRDRPEILEDGLFILAEEYGDWEDSSRSIDLLALDADGRLVVIELKRSDRNSFMDLQALRYAAMVANMTLKQAIDAHRQYIHKRGGNPEDAPALISERLALDDDENASIDSAKPRIILVSANFSKELTTSALWLNEIGADITCIKLQPWQTDDAVFLESSQVIPIPEATDYMVRIRNREEENRQLQQASKAERHQGSSFFRQTLDKFPQAKTPLVTSMLDLAESLAEVGQAELWTRSGLQYTVLRPQLPDATQGFFNITIDRRMAIGYLNLGSSHLLEKLAPKSKAKLEQILQEPIRTRAFIHNLPQGFRGAMRNAYREAVSKLS